ncbi:MAG: hypothetical protein HKN36_05755 [Hellea sp.]|nr:hypothetical protein [Hellea sp.]
MEQYLPTLIMLAITVAFTALILFPTRFKFGTDLVRFYWIGFWVFLAMISFVAGGSQVLSLAGFQIDDIAVAALTGILTSFVLFVVFAWVRLAGAAMFEGFRRIRKTA